MLTSKISHNYNHYTVSTDLLKHDKKERKKDKNGLRQTWLDHRFLFSTKPSTLSRLLCLADELHIQEGLIII